MRSTQFLFLSLSILTLALQGCTPKNIEKTQESFWQGVERIFSIRPQNQTHVVAIVRLKSPAILADLSVPARGELSEEVKAEIKSRAEILDQEQKAFLEEVKSITADHQVLASYRFLLNGMAVRIPMDAFEKIKGLGNVLSTDASTSIERPRPVSLTKDTMAAAIDLTETSVKFIQALEAHAAGIRGQGLRVGVIDTGVDFTHSMLGGEGTVEAYKAVNPNEAHPSFPNAKVVGGYDFVGLEYNAASPDFSKRVPKPDVNPIDESGHGTHVAGTVAGKGDGVQSYDGVAPDALIYALKVFGKDGSTSDEVVLASLEYSIDPNGDLDISDRLDVVNMSLGSSYGSPHILYNEAITNLTRGGVVVVASAGNSGNNDYITGAPATSDDAISVAASVDNMAHNWKFRAVEFIFDSEVVTSEAIEASISKPIADAGDVSGELVFVGLAAEDFSPEVAEKVKGKIALIDRGVVEFQKKLKRAAEAGAIGAVVANNVDGEPMVMGGEGKVEIPAIMIKKSLGDRIKAFGRPVMMKFQTPLKIDKPELIDTLTGFSSKGPRSIDGFIKPDISSPGASIVSADVGKGTEAVKMSGTSMAGPHVAGVMALLRQQFPQLSVKELQSVLMGSAKSIGDAEGKNYLISRQGAGRVQIMNALKSEIVSSPVSLSLGELQIERKKSLLKQITYKNISSAPKKVTVEFRGHPAMTFDGLTSLELQPQEEQTLELVVHIDGTQLKESFSEVDGLLVLTTEGKEVHRVPVLAVVSRVSQGVVESVTVASSEVAPQGALVEVMLKNSSTVASEALLFNLISEDGRKEDLFHDIYRNRQCDLQASGYRIVERKDSAGKKTRFLQVAVKIFEPATSWHTCEVNVQIDSNGDGIADQEIAGAPQERVPPLSSTNFGSILLNANKAREVRKKFEEEFMKGGFEEPPKENYEEALEDLQKFVGYTQSTVAIVEADLAKLNLRPTGEMAVKISTTHVDSGAIELFDFLGLQNQQWQGLTVAEQGPGFVGMPEVVKIPAGEMRKVRMTRGFGSERLMVLFPQNEVIRGPLLTDKQMALPAVKYQK